MPGDNQADPEGLLLVGLVQRLGDGKSPGRDGATRHQGIAAEIRMHELAQFIVNRPDGGHALRECAEKIIDVELLDRPAPLGLWPPYNRSMVLTPVASASVAFLSLDWPESASIKDASFVS